MAFNEEYLGSRSHLRQPLKHGIDVAGLISSGHDNGDTLGRKWGPYPRARDLKYCERNPRNQRRHKPVQQSIETEKRDGTYNSLFLVYELPICKIEKTAYIK